MSARTAVVLGLLVVAALAVGSLPLRDAPPARDTSTEILVRLAEDGRLSVFVGPDEHNRREVGLDAARFGDARAATSRATIEALQPVLNDLAGAVERAPNDTSRMRMRIEVAPRARVLWLMWLMQMGTAPRAGIARYDLSSRGRAETVTWVLPSDGFLFVDGEIHRRPLDPDMYVSMELPAPDRAGRMTLRVERHHRDEPRRLSPFGPRGANGASPPFPTVTLDCRVDAAGTPTPLEPLVAEVGRLRELDPEPETLWLRVTYPEGDTGGGLGARTLIDVFAALQGIEGIEVECGSDSSRQLDPRVARAAR